MDTTTSTAKAQAFVGLFQFQATIVQNAQLGLTEALALKRPSGHNNHINWMLGHLLHCRYMLAKMLGVAAENPFGNTYWEALDNRSYPPVGEVMQHFPAISAQLMQALGGLTDAELDAQPDPDQPSLTEMVSFFVYHEAYHIGQIGYARKGIGMEAMKSN